MLFKSSVSLGEGNIIMLCLLPNTFFVWTFHECVCLEMIYFWFALKMMLCVLLHLTVLLVRTSSFEDSPLDKLKSVSGAHHGNSVQHGECSYIFLLPEPEKSSTGDWPEEYEAIDEGNSLQKEPSRGRQSCLNQRIQHLELTVNNSTRWLQSVSKYLIEFTR